MKIIKIQEDENGELFLPIPDDILESLGIGIGDSIIWTDNNDGTFILTKVTT